MKHTNRTIPTVSNPVPELILTTLVNNATVVNQQTTYNAAVKITAELPEFANFITLTMTPAQARQLAKDLVKTAKEAEEAEDGTN